MRSRRFTWGAGLRLGSYEISHGSTRKARTKSIRSRARANEPPMAADKNQAAGITRKTSTESHHPSPITAIRLKRQDAKENGCFHSEFLCNSLQYRLDQVEDRQRHAHNAG